MARHLALALVLAAAAGAAAQQPPPALRSLAPPGLRIGAALNAAQSDGRDPVALAIVERHFNTVSPENVLKWEAVHPEADRFDFGPADRYVEFGARRGLFVVGHVLLWHQQTPDWVFAGVGGRPLDRDTALARLRAHIDAVVGRYRGRIGGWDVVNEALEEDGTLRKTPWLAAIGEDYVAKAFEFAHAADPDAELYYNDYNLWKPAKRDAAVRLVQGLRAKGLRVDGVGEQGHWGLDDPPLDAIDATLGALRGSGARVLVTELDIDVLPRDPDMWGADLAKKTAIRAATNVYPDGLPEAVQQRLARRYADVFRLFLKHDVGRVTFWGVTDATTWLDDFPVPGRVNYPLLWDRQGREKPAFGAVVDVLREHAATAGRGAAAALPRWSFAPDMIFPADRSLHRPEDGVVLPDGRLVVADQLSGLRLLAPDGSGRPFGRFAEAGYRHSPPEIVSTINGVTLEPSGTHILGADVFRGGIYRVNVATEAVERVYQHPFGVNMARADRRGGVWFTQSTRNGPEHGERDLFRSVDVPTPDGVLYYLPPARDGSPRVAVPVVEGLRFANGLVLDETRGHLYVAETLGKRVLRFRVDTAAGTVSERTTVFEGAHPDNVELDQHGRLWIALPMSSEIAVLDLASGKAARAFSLSTPEQAKVLATIEARIAAGASWLELFGPPLWEPAPGAMTGMILSPGDGPVFVTGLGNALIRLPR
jgi:endo-1,4-beta-xylanase